MTDTNNKLRVKFVNGEIPYEKEISSIKDLTEKEGIEFLDIFIRLKKKQNQVKRIIGDLTKLFYSSK
jgi:hypothetical protein